MLVNLFATPARRNFLFAALYMSEGAPIGFLWWALPTKLRAAGLPIEQITTLTSLFVLPWAFKFLWAPLIDTLRSERWTFRSWILTMQLFMGLTLLPLFWLNFASDFSWIAFFLIAHAVCAATQDVSIDALCISTTTHHERGAINGWMQAGMLAGRALLGGGALVLSSHVGDRWIIALLIAVIWLPSVLLLASREPRAAIPFGSAEGTRGRDFLSLLKTILRQRTTWFGLLFAALAGAGFEAVGAVAGPFLLDHGGSSSEVGWFFLLPVIVCMSGGALLGGYLADRFQRRRVVAVFLVLMATIIFALAGADVMIDTPSSISLVVLMGVLYVGIGLFTSSSYALLMDVSHPRLAATQFSAFMGATNLCESWSSFAVGTLVGGFGYPAAFVAMAVASFLALPFLKGLRID
jgi:PAT family beta-lactamase induction signal transducer AmpG